MLLYILPEPQHHTQTDTRPAMTLVTFNLLFSHTLSVTHEDWKFKIDISPHTHWAGWPTPLAQATTSAAPNRIEKHTLHWAARWAAVIPPAIPTSFYCS